MSQAQDTRQQLYDRIKSSTKDAVILEEMIRLGFWKQGDGANGVPEQVILKEAELVKQINELTAKQRLYQNREAALKEMRKARLAESKRKRAERKELKKQEVLDKANKWAEQKSKDITYLGENVSKRLNETECNPSLLAKYGLPSFGAVEDLAKAMEVSVADLRFLSYSRTVSTVNHYKKFNVPKKSGGTRLISAPMPRLKSAQYWILETLLNKITLHDAAHGFVKKKSILSNAQNHVKADLLINLDLKDFFPSILYPRVKGLFKSLGYSEKIATILALICTEPETDEVELDGKKYFVALSERKLPQGAPTSPAITNIICRRLDARLRGLAQKYGFVYTRYADDLSFSTKGEAAEKAHQLLSNIRKVLKDEDFTIHPDKLKIMRKGACKEVTGIIVNDKPAIKAKELDKFRALIYQIEKEGSLEGKHWNGAPNLLAAIQGYANFVYMVDPTKGEPLKLRVKALLAKHDYKHTIKHLPKAKQQPVQDSKSQPVEKKDSNNKPWWKIW